LKGLENRRQLYLFPYPKEGYTTYEMERNNEKGNEGRKRINGEGFHLF